MAYKLLLTATLKQSGKNKCAVEGWGHFLFVYFCLTPPPTHKCVSVSEKNYGQQLNFGHFFS